ncbi:MAG TPA: hypothetical protein VGB45_13825 [Abditibacterium sp.]|jgi:hypothetical protein
MSDNSSPETQAEAPVEKKKTPLELVKERKAAMNQNRGIKGAKSGASDKVGGVAEAPSSKPMRSSASKQGG